MIDFREFECFCVLAKTLHFQEAADRLNISSPTLSRIINRVEGQVGTKLLQRTTRTVTLTPAGAVFYQKAQELLELHGNTELFYKQLKSGSSGKLTVSYGGLPIETFLPSVIGEYKDLFPEVDLTLLLQRIIDQEDALLAGTTDIGFFSGTPRHSDLEYQLVHAEPLLFITARDSEFADRASISIEEISELNLVLGKPESWVDVYEDFFKKAESYAPLNIVQYADDVASVMALVSLGIGHSIMPGGDINLRRAGVAYIPIKGFNGKIRLNAVWRRDRMNPALTNFKDLLTFKLEG